MPDSTDPLPALTGLRSICDLDFLSAQALSSPDDLKAGDLIVGKGPSSPLSDLISKLDGYWSHSAIYVGGGVVAHAHADGISLGTISAFLARYTEALGVARFDVTDQQRQSAAEWARAQTGDAVTSRYSGRDLGLAYSLLRRAKNQPEVLGLLARLDADDGREISMRDIDLESTCSGFVYRAYLHAGVRLPINPAPGIRLTDDHQLYVPSEDSLIEELRSASEGSAAEIGAVGRRAKEHGSRMRYWIELSGLLTGAAKGIATSVTQDQIPIEAGVTPSDLWTSPRVAERYFVTSEHRRHALAATDHCPGHTPIESANEIDLREPRGLVPVPAMWDDETSPRLLVDFLAAGRVGPAEELLGLLHADVRATHRKVPDAVAESVVLTLRDYTFFDWLRTTADVLRGAAPADGFLRYLHAVAAIELGDLTEALDSLNALRSELIEQATSTDLVQKQKAQKLLPQVDGSSGHAYKQLYIDAKPTKTVPRDHDRDSAIRFYKAAFEDRPGENYWHGINWVALHTHAERIKTDSVSAVSADVGSICEAIIRFVKTEPGYWALATRLEAHVALGEIPQAIAASEEIMQLEHHEVTQFQLTSTIRQLEQLYLMTDERPPGDRLLVSLKAKAAALPGGSILIDPQHPLVDEDQMAPSELERVFGDTSYRPISWMHEAQTRARAVVRIGMRRHGPGAGSGFLLDPAVFADAPWYRDDLGPMVMTNAHVCSPDPIVQQDSALQPERALVTFLGHPDTPVSRVVGVLATSPPQELDFSILELEGSAPADVVAPPVSGLRDAEPGARLSIIGHPHGGEMQVSIQDNRLTDLGDQRMWYTTPTDPGSSGSPVFDDDWYVVGLHRAASFVREANEGVRIERIIEAALQSSQPLVLSEAG